MTDALATQTMEAGRHRALGGRLLDAAVAGQAGLGGVDVASGLAMGGSGAQFVGSVAECQVRWKSDPVVPVEE
jgi:hypothetical protein